MWAHGRSTDRRRRTQDSRGLERTKAVDLEGEMLVMAARRFLSEISFRALHGRSTLDSGRVIVAFHEHSPEELGRGAVP